VPVELDIELNGRLPPAVEATGYYVVAEALANVTRHARAHNATVTIRLEGNMLRVEVADDGQGGADVARGSGLRGLADRLDAIAGRLEISSSPSDGTRVLAVIPCG
jgi:signal transduction histidine kinase